MTIQTSVDVAGLKELEEALQKLPKELVGKNGGPVRTALMNAGLEMMKDMKRKVDASLKDDGELLKTIGRRRDKNPKGLSEAISVGALGTRRAAEYRIDDQGNKTKRTFLSPWWLEFGTVRIPKDAFIRPAFDSNKEEAVRRFRKNLATSIERIGKKIGNENAQKVGARIKKL